MLSQKHRTSLLSNPHVHKILLKSNHIFFSKYYLIQVLYWLFQDLFVSFQIVSIKETTLGANQWLQDNKRLKFGAGGNLEDVTDQLDGLNKSSSVANENYWTEGLFHWRQSQTESNDVTSNFSDYVDVSNVSSSKNDFVIALSPMQIKTFVVEVKRGWARRWSLGTWNYFLFCKLGIVVGYIILFVSEFLFFFSIMHLLHLESKIRTSIQFS